MITVGEGSNDSNCVSIIEENARWFARRNGSLRANQRPLASGSVSLFLDDRNLHLYSIQRIVFSVSGLTDYSINSLNP